jgi:hypothetical protein
MVMQGRREGRLIIVLNYYVIDRPKHRRARALGKDHTINTKPSFEISSITHNKLDEETALKTFDRVPSAVQ